MTLNKMWALGLGVVAVAATLAWIGYRIAAVIVRLITTFVGA